MLSSITAGVGPIYAMRRDDYIELVKGRARVRRAALEESLHGRFTDHHARMARLLLDQIDELNTHIGAVTALLDAAIAALPLIPLTTREVRHLLARLIWPAPTCAPLICHWSWWRRAHQYWAGYYHRRRREKAG